MTAAHAIGLAAALLLCACNAAPTRTPAPAVPAQCDARCLTACAATNPRWDVDPQDPKAWDVLGDQVIAPLIEQRDTCEKHRVACTQCLTRLEAAGLICGVAKECVQ